MRNWHPFIRGDHGPGARCRRRAPGRHCLAPQFSELSVGLYIRRTEEAAREAGVTAEIVWARSFHDEPLLIEAFAERLAPLVGRAGKVLFTAHSLPEKAWPAGDPYDRETRATAAAVAARLGLRIGTSPTRARA